MKYLKSFILCLVAASLLPGAALADTSRLGSDSATNFNQTAETTKTSDYTVTTSDSLIRCTTSSANLTFTLPSISSVRNAQANKSFKLLKTDANDYSCIFSPATGDTVGGESARYINQQNDYIIISLGAGRDWQVDYESPYFQENHETGALSFSGLGSTELTSDTTLSGVTPLLTIGDGGAEDAGITFDGVQDYYIQVDDTGGTQEDLLTFGVGAVVGTTPVFSLNATQQIVLENNDTIDNITDDTVEIKSDDNNTRVQVTGFEAKESQLTLLADQDDDATDGWEIASLTTGSLTIGNDSSVAGTFVDKLTIAGSTGNVTLTGDIVNENTDTIVMSTDDALSFQSNDEDSAFQALGFEAKEGTIELLADQDDDATDGWEIAATTGGNLTIGNDSSVAGTFVDKVTIAGSTGNVTLTGDIINENADTVVMSNDDILQFTSNDGAATIQVLGFEANSAILSLDADEADDDADTWTFTVADGGALTIANEGTATMTVSEAMDITGTITLAEDEVISNAVDDTVSVTSNDGNTNFLIKGFEASNSVLTLSADEADDAGDTWTFSVADAGALTIANDGTATMTINEVVALGSGMTSVPVVVTDAATYAVTAANSGRVHLIGDLSQNTNINLPAEAAGLYYEFVYVGGADDAHDHTIDSENNTNYMVGGVAFADTDAGDAADEINAGVYSDGNSNSQITLNNASAGTRVIVWCQDGTHWYITGVVFSDTVPAFADN